VRGDQRLELAEHLTVPAELEVELDPLDHGGQPLLLEARTLGLEPLGPVHAGERLAAPDGERLVETRARGGRVAIRLRPPGEPEHLPPAIEVALAGLELEHVAARAGDEAAA